MFVCLRLRISADVEKARIMMYMQLEIQLLLTISIGYTD